MTTKRKDIFGTQFGDWLREQSEIDSSLGYNTSNLDYYWTDKKGNILLIEEKRKLAKLTDKQKEIFYTLDRIILKAKEAYKKENANLFYHGFYLIQFENTTPEDGKIYINNKLISKNDLIKFLKFELKIEPYDFSKPYY